jgi:diguanylate cyclase (GGDEF)-like protein
MAKQAEGPDGSRCFALQQYGSRRSRISQVRTFLFARIAGVQRRDRARVRTMRDPRLAEIDFLMDIEQHGLMKVRTVLSAEEERYGLDAARFRDMVVALIVAGHVCGTRLRTDGKMSVTYLEGERDIIMALLGTTQSFDLILSHAGRVHLWNARDALLRDAEMEPMGLKNKAAWERDLFLRLRWATPSAPLAIVFVDLDDFGKVNKQLGHAVGDDVLRATFELVKNLVGARGAAYRYGGEEIGILLPETAQAAAEGIAEELRQIIETEVSRQVRELGKPQTASIGVASFMSTTEPRVAVEHVDSLMQTSKTTGKNKVTSKPFTLT